MTRSTSTAARPPLVRVTRNLSEEAQVVRHLLARERLSIDDPQPGRTCFLSHLGAQEKLAPGPWIGHRELLWGLALANLSPMQRTSLARAVLVEHGHVFGVGRLELEPLRSGLPLGGSSLWLKHRRQGPSCLYTWAVGEAPQPRTCEWLLLRAQPEWTSAEPLPQLKPKGLSVLAALGGEVVVLVPSAVAAVQVAGVCHGKVAIAAHPRFAPYCESLDPDAAVLLWPHDALDGAGLRRHKIVAVVLVGASEAVRQSVHGWLARRSSDTVEVVDVACPGWAGRDQLAAFWRACGEPAVFLTGDPVWAAQGQQWLQDLGAHVHVQGAATQLELL